MQRSLNEKVRALSRLPGVAKKIETHMAWVFLTERHAYKLKKPVRLDYLDFSTIEKRRLTCKEEVRLNRRLAPDVYLGTLPLTLDRERIELSGSGEIVDWVIWMRRLPEDRFMDRLIAGRRIREEDLHRLAETLVHFHHQAAPAGLSAPEYRERLFGALLENERELASFDVDSRLVFEAIGPCRNMIERSGELLDRRVGAGRIVEGHGDLRPEHVCMLDPPVVIDCIEFNREFRLVDAVSDVAFLSLECERLGAPRVRSTLLEAYRWLARDDPSPELIHLYQAVHASTRAKIALWHLRDPDHSDPQHWRDKARKYLRLAAEHGARTIPQS